MRQGLGNKRLAQIIKESEQQNRALSHLNFSCLEQIKGIFEAVEETNLPVIAAVSEKERKFLGAGLAKNLVDYFNFCSGKKLIFLSADHCRSFDSIKEAAKANYDLIVVDFSKFSFEQNLKKTKKAVKLIKSINPKILIEGELGYLPGKSKILNQPPKEILGNKTSFYTKLEEAEIFVKETKIDLLAPSVGNFHGKVLNFSPKIDIDLIKKIKQKIKIPLVIHGGSGIKKFVLKEVIKSGVSIVHFNTDIREAWKKGLQKGLNQNKKEIAPYKILPTAINSAKQRIMQILMIINH